MAFVDLAKAFDTVDHKMSMRVLERYGAPPKLRSAIARMYADLKIILKLGKAKAEMNQTVGVRQGDCMAPVLFLFMMMAFAETLEKEWRKTGIDMVTFHQRTHLPRDKGFLNGHKRSIFANGTLFGLFSVLYVDDGAFPFDDRAQMEKRVELIFSHFTKFGLEMHIGRGGEPSKT